MGRKKPEPYAIDGIALGWRDGQAVADFRDEAGRRHRARLGATTEAEARAALARFAEARRAVKAQQAAHTIGDLWRMWLADRAKDGLRNDIYSANWVSLAPAFSHRHPATLTTDDGRDYARERFAAGRSAWTVHTELTRLRACMQWAARHRHIDRAPYVWVPSPGKARSRVLSAEEAKRLLDGAMQGDPHVYTFVVLALSTGARHAAILDLTWDRIDWQRGLIHYDDEIERDPMSKGWRKGRASVPMNALARQALELAFAGRQTAHVIEHGGRRLKSIRDGFEAAARRAGLDDVTPHTVRHSVATWARERGVELGRIARLLGHRDSRTTETIYSHPDAGAYLGEAVAALPQLHGGSSGDELKR